MRALCKRLFDDESGVILSAEIVMVATVGVLALVAGWNAVSASLAGELADVANAFGSLNQSYNVKSINAVGHARCSGHGYNDSDTLVSVSGSGAAVAFGGGGGGQSASVGGRAEAFAAAEALVALDVVEVGPAVVEETIVATGSSETAAFAEATASANASVDVAADSLEGSDRTRLLATLQAELSGLEAEAARLEALSKSQTNRGDSSGIAPQAQSDCELLRAEHARLLRLVRQLCRDVNGD